MVDRTSEGSMGIGEGVNVGREGWGGVRQNRKVGIRGARGESRGGGRLREGAVSVDYFESVTVVSLE